MKQILEIPLAELTTVRLTCKEQGCNGIIEASLLNLEQKSLLCPVCKKEFRRVNSDEGLNQLCAGVRNLLHPNVPFNTEFLVIASQKDL